MLHDTAWRNSGTRKVWEGERPRQFGNLDHGAAIDLLLALNIAKSLHDLSPLRRELGARALSAHRLALDLGVPPGRIADIVNGRRAITADTAVRLGRYFGNPAQFWLDLQSQYDIAVVKRERGADIVRQVRPADAACVGG